MSSQYGQQQRREAEIVRLKQANAALLAACQSAHALLRRLGGTNHDPEYSELAAAIAAATGKEVRP